MREGYSGGGGRPKRMTRKQIQEMVKNMSKTGEIANKSDKYHEGEIIEAEELLKQFNLGNEDHINDKDIKDE